MYTRTLFIYIMIIFAYATSLTWGSIFNSSAALITNLHNVGPSCDPWGHPLVSFFTKV